MGNGKCVGKLIFSIFVPLKNNWMFMFNSDIVL